MPRRKILNPIGRASVWLVSVLVGLLFLPPRAYAGGGVPLWTNYYRGPGITYDSPKAIAVDNAGNVFVTGDSGDSSGDLTFATVAYAASGLPLWTNRYKGPGHQDFPMSIAADTNGHVVVTGFSAAADNVSEEYATVAYSTSGVPLWTNRFQWPGNTLSLAMALALDTSGNVFVTGYSGYSALSSLDYATVAYSSSGLPLWTNRYNGAGNSNDVAKAIAVDHNGNVFVTGSSLGQSGSWNYATIKYSGTGVALWTNLYSTRANGDSIANAIVVDKNSNVFVTGWSTGDTGYSNYATVAYSASGVPLWTNLFSESVNNHNDAQALAVDSKGNVFVTGFTRNFASGATYDVTLGYAASGTPLWTNRTDGFYADDGQAVTLDSSGNVFVTAALGTIAYSGAGVPLWTNSQYGGLAIATDPSGSVIVTQEAYSEGYGPTGYVTIKYSSTAGPYLSIAQAAGEMVLSWSNAVFTLLAAPMIAGPFTNVPGATSPYTNPITGEQRYFRLVAP